MRIASNRVIRIFLFLKCYICVTKQQTNGYKYADSQEETEQTEKWYQTEQFRHICKTALVLLVNLFRVWAVFFAFFYILLNGIN